MNNLTAADLTVIFNGVLFIILLAAAILLIRRIRQRRRTLDQPFRSAQVTFPFPQRQVDRNVVAGCRINLLQLAGHQSQRRGQDQLMQLPVMGPDSLGIEAVRSGGGVGLPG